MASYAVSTRVRGDNDRADDDFDIFWREVLPEGIQAMPGVQVRTEVVPGLAARVLLERCADADMLVLGAAVDTPGSTRSAGPVIRACLRRAPCPVVVISAAQVPFARAETVPHPTDLHVSVPA
jgi:hypothetical protein